MENKKMILNEDEYNTTFAALKLIEALYKQGKVAKHIFNNILIECSEKIDVTSFNRAA